MARATLYRLFQLTALSGLEDQGHRRGNVAVYVGGYVENSDGSIEYHWTCAQANASKLSRKAALRAADRVEADQKAYRLARGIFSANAIRVRAVTGGEELAR